MATETWVINEIPQWIGISSRDFSIQFTSNNQSFTLFRFNRSGVNQYDLQYNDVVVNGGTWNSSLNRPNWTGWTNEAYRTITFATPPTGDLLTWLQANGVKQQPTYKFKHWKKSNVKVNRTLVGQKYYYFKPYTILGLYTITTTLTNCTGASANATKIQENSDLTLTFTANSGYELPTGVSVTNVTSYNWNKATGVLAISKPTGDVAIEIVAVSALPQLSTPTNVAVTDTTLTFDEVANATSYEVFVDNVSIGTHTIASGYNVNVVNYSKNGSGDWYISTDNGTNYTKITGTGVIATNVETVKFKLIRTAKGMSNDEVLNYSFVQSTTAGTNIIFQKISASAGTYESENLTITEGSSDVIHQAIVPTGTKELKIYVGISYDD